jgi:hypothetical protein
MALPIVSVHHGCIQLRARSSTLAGIVRSWRDGNWPKVDSETAKAKSLLSLISRVVCFSAGYVSTLLFDSISVSHFPASVELYVNLHEPLCIRCDPYSSRQRSHVCFLDGLQIFSAKHPLCFPFGSSDSFPEGKSAGE